MSGPGSDDSKCVLCEPPIDLGDRGILSLRHAHPGDEALLEELYETLGQDDLSRRFFTPGVPGGHFLEGWVSVEERGGLCLLAILTDPDGSENLIAEAGYAPVADGDVELGMTVSPDHRGWTGPWLLDVLLAHARERGIENMQAVVKTGNRAMLDLIRHRGCARFDEDDWNTTRVTMATQGHTPSWPPDSPHPRILVESDRSRPQSARQLSDEGGTVLVCGGYEVPGSHCPLHEGEPCPLIEGADAVVVDRRSADHTEDLPGAIRAQRPDVEVTIVKHDQGP